MTPYLWIVSSLMYIMAVADIILFIAVKTKGGKAEGSMVLKALRASMWLALSFIGFYLITTIN